MSTLDDVAKPQNCAELAEDLRNGRPTRIGAVVHGPEEVVEALAAGVGVGFISAGNADLHRSRVYVTGPVPGLPPPTSRCSDQPIRAKSIPGFG